VVIASRGKVDPVKARFTLGAGGLYQKRSKFTTPNYEIKNAESCHQNPSRQAWK